MRIELRHLRYFVAVAEELHFGRAADRVRVAQPALSRQIRQLETYVGAALFERTSRTVRLTAAGATFVPRAQELLDRLSADVSEAARIARGESGRLDIAFISSAAQAISSTLSVFAHERPDVRVRLHEGFTDASLDLVERAAADLAIVRDADEREGISVTPLVVEEFVVVLPTTHRLAGRATVTAGQLAAYPLILFPARAGDRARSLNLQPFHERSLEADIALEGSSWGTILQLVAAGLGVTIAPRSVVSPLPEGTTAIPLAGSKARSVVQLAIRTHDDRPLVSRFQDIALAREGR